VLVIVEAVEAQSSGAQSSGAQYLAETAQGGSQSSGAHSLAGMTKTSTCVFHLTDREGCRQTSTRVSQLTDRGGFCRGLPPGPQGRAELRWTRDESLDTALGLQLLLALRGFGEMFRSNATGSMLWGVWGRVQERER